MSILIGSFGPDAEGHERLLNGLELNTQKAAGRVLLVSAHSVNQVRAIASSSEVLALHAVERNRTRSGRVRLFRSVNLTQQ